MKLVGKCNQCGLCCFEGRSKCVYLEIKGLPGQPMATSCKVHAERFPGMPIVLVDGNKVTAVGACAHGSSVDDEVIIQKGIGKGCSLMLVEN